MPVPSGSPEKITDRDQLIVETLPLVRHIVKLISAKLPIHLDRDDMFGAGVIGLMDAAEKFDPTFNVKFSDYAWHRIVGGVWDHLRKLRVPMESLDDIRAELRLSTERAPDQTAMDSQVKRQLIQAINSLGERERLVIVLKYYEDMSKEEIAEILGISHSNLRLIMWRARRKLKDSLLQFRPS